MATYFQTLASEAVSMTTAEEVAEVFEITPGIVRRWVEGRGEPESGLKDHVIGELERFITEKRRKV